MAAFILSQVWVWVRPQPRLGRRIHLALGATFFVSLFWPTAYLAALPLTRVYQPVTLGPTPGRTIIILLGAGHGVSSDWRGADLPVIDDTVVERIGEAARQYHLSGDARIISSGGGDNRSVWTDAEIMRRELVRLGVPDEHIIKEDTSAITRDEVLAVADILKQQPAQRIVLVTSQLHMVRSIGAFRAGGIDPIPVVSRDGWPHAWWIWLAPSGGALSQTSAVFHEYLGIAMYWARGWYK